MQPTSFKKGGPVHKAPTWWCMGRVDVHSLNPASGEAVSRIWICNLQIIRQLPYRCAKAHPLCNQLHFNNEILVCHWVWSFCSFELSKSLFIKGIPKNLMKWWSITWRLKKTKFTLKNSKVPKIIVNRNTRITNVHIKSQDMQSLNRKNLEIYRVENHIIHANEKGEW